MPLLDLDAIPQVELQFQNDDHREEGRLLNEVAAAISSLRDGRGSKEQVLSTLGALDRHTRDHFAREEDAMRRARFPPYAMHAGDHARVLAEMESEARAFAEKGDVERLWRYVSQAVPAWFVTHIQTMDLVTSRFVRQSGG